MPRKCFFALSILTATLFVVGAIANAENLVVNGTFDNALSNWKQIKVSSISSFPQFGIADTPVCVPSRSNNPGGYINVPFSSVGALEQDITIGEASSLTLSFLVFGQLDTVNLAVKIVGSVSGQQTLDQFSAVTPIAGYSGSPPVFTCNSAVPVTKTYDVSAFKNQTVTLRFEATSSGNDGTFVIIDDVTLEATGGSYGGAGSGPGNNSKRSTSTTMFCNRSGTNLESAKCSVTVADAGASPRSLPSGTVDFSATDGFLPSSASCQLQQTSYSPGIGACDVQFSVPAGFGIGIKFPINAVYSGDSSFNSSSTSHKLINPGCVSTPGKAPCPNSVGLYFNGIPEVVKNKISLLLDCGSGNSTSATKSKLLAAVEEDETPPGGTCKVKGKVVFNVPKFLFTINPNDYQTLEFNLPEDPSKDTSFETVVRALAKESDERIEKMKKTQDLIFELSNDILKDRIKNQKQVKAKLDGFIKEARLRRSQSVKGNKANELASNTIEFNVSSDKTKKINLRLGKRLAKISALHGKSGLSIPLKLEFTIKQKKRFGSVKVSEEIDVVNPD